MLWWTILLNLLLDDDKTVRQIAATVVCKIGKKSEPFCDVEIRREFFNKFTILVSNKRPDIGMVILFAWGVATWREESYEMDDTDVNKTFFLHFLRFFCLLFLYYYLYTRSK